MFSINGVYAQTLHAGRSLPPNLLRKALEGCLTFGREVMSLPSVDILWSLTCIGVAYEAVNLNRATRRKGAIIGKRLPMES